MSIDTTNKKLALLELEDIWEPGLPMSPGTFEQDDQQQLLWGYPGLLWDTVIIVTPCDSVAAQSVAEGFYDSVVAQAVAEGFYDSVVTQ